MNRRIFIEMYKKNPYNVNIICKKCIISCIECEHGFKKSIETSERLLDRLKK